MAKQNDRQAEKQTEGTSGVWVQSPFVANWRDLSKGRFVYTKSYQFIHKENEVVMNTLI